MLTALGTLLLGVPFARPCDTPVHQFALQNWVRGPYVLLYVGEGEAPQVVAKPVAELAYANLVLKSARPGELAESENTALRAAWQRHAEGGAPFFALLSPAGAVIHAGTVVESDLIAVTHSPARERLTGQILHGKQGVLLLLECSDDKENSRAGRVLKHAVARAAERSVAVGSVVVRRDDPRETWLVRQLLAVESDLAGIDKPMIFGVFGRGYALPPYLGKGITDPNICDLVAFMNGPCTCEIKAATEGVDLLTAFDWDAAVIALQAGTTTEEDAMSPPAVIAGERTSSLAPARQERPTRTGRNVALLVGLVLVLMTAVAATMFLRSR